MTTSWRPEVKTYTDNQWTANGLRFATEPEAAAYARDLMRRWTLVTATRAAESDDPVNYRWSDEDGLAELKP